MAFVDMPSINFTMPTPLTRILSELRKPRRPVAKPVDAFREAAASDLEHFIQIAEFSQVEKLEHADLARLRGALYADRAA